MKELTLANQGELCYTISPLNKPRLHIDPGDSVVIETQDAYSGQIRREEDRRDLDKIPWANPQSGPIYVKGARKGDTLAVTILDIEPLTGQGATRTISLWYPIKSDIEVFQRFLNAENVPHGTRICPIRDGRVYFGKLVLPYQPVIGTIGTADPMETRLTWVPGPYGGNMDLPQITRDATVHLPVGVDGALLHLGDAHAVQGDGEGPSGSVVEMPSRTTVKVDLIKGQTINWPRLENSEMIFSIAASETGRSLQDAIRLASMELAFWLERSYSFERWPALEALAVLSQIRIGNIWTVAVGVPKKYLSAP
jgi:acetamidase/formamidase